MIQEINLAKKIGKKDVGTSLISWKQYWYLNAFFLLFMLFLFIINVISHQFLIKKYHALISLDNSLNKEFFDIKNQYPGLFFSKDVAKTLEDLQIDLKNQKEMLQDISIHVPVSDYLSALSKTINNNTWLTEIQILNFGKVINLKGKSINSILAKQFFENLLQNASFGTFILSINNMSDSRKSTNDPIEFDITLTKRSI